MITPEQLQQAQAARDAEQEAEIETYIDSKITATDARGGDWPCLIPDTHPSWRKEVVGRVLARYQGVGWQIASSPGWLCVIGRPGDRMPAGRPPA